MMDREMRIEGNAPTEKKDIFDKIMGLPVLNIFEPFYKKNKEMLLYLFFGGLSFIVSVATYAFFNMSLGLSVLLANVLSWIITVMFAFLTNRVWVFEAPTKTLKDFTAQMISFYSGRIVTLVIEEAILVLFIDMLGFGSIAVKIVAQIVVILLNYVISKVFIFKK